MQHTSYREQRFRVNAGSAFVGMFAALLLVGGTFVLIAHFGWNRPIYWFWDGVVAPALYAILLAGAVWYLRLRLTVTAMPEGVRTFDVWGRYCTVPWESLTAARRWSFFGMRSARLVSSANKAPLWLPLDLDEPEAFRALAEAYTEPQNPVRDVLPPTPEERAARKKRAKKARKAKRQPAGNAA